MNYQRVIPRDFFNEAKLLKCMGRLALKIVDNKLPEGVNIEIEESGEAFKIIQDAGDGSISVVNYPVTVNGKLVPFYTGLNSKEIYPLTCTIDEVEYTVFDYMGEFEPEFIEAAKKIK